MEEDYNIDNIKVELQTSGIDVIFEDKTTLFISNGTLLSLKATSTKIPNTPLRRISKKNKDFIHKNRSNSY